MTGQLAYCSLFPSLMSLSRHIARHLSLPLPLFLFVHCNRLLGGDVFILFPTLYVLPPIRVLSRIFGEQRLDFTRKSIVYLFRTTYTSADSLTIAALVAYMNAALPPDKHEEFDTAEVTRAAKTLHDRGSVAFEGDMLKPLH